MRPWGWTCHDQIIIFQKYKVPGKPVFRARYTEFPTNAKAKAVSTTEKFLACFYGMH